MTTTARQTAKLTTPALRWWSGLVVLYTVLIFGLPANQLTMHTYHLASLEYHILLFAVALPTMLVWLAAFWGYGALRQYAHSIEQSSEGRHFNQLATGCYWLAWSLPLSTITPLVLNTAADRWSAWHSPAIIITNYPGLLLQLIAFSLIGNAARCLIGAAKFRFSLTSARLITLFFVLAGVLYCYLTFRHFEPTSLTSAHNPYSLPVWLAILTVIVQKSTRPIVPASPGLCGGRAGGRNYRLDCSAVYQQRADLARPSGAELQIIDNVAVPHYWWRRLYPAGFRRQTT